MTNAARITVPGHWLMTQATLAWRYAAPDQPFADWFPPAKWIKANGVYTYGDQTFTNVEEEEVRNETD